MGRGVEPRMTLRAFNLEIDRFMDEDVPDVLVRVHRVLSIAALNGVVLKSPVDTGRFRGAWLTTIDIRTTSAPETTGSAGAAAGRSINDGIGVIAGLTAFQNLIIQNNVEYGEELEDGASKTQAPAGMLSVTVAELARLVK